MAPTVIDLTSSPEPEESSEEAAKSALQSFQPRAQKLAPPKEKKRNARPTQSPRETHRATVQQLQPWRSDISNGQTGETPRSVPSLLEVVNSLSKSREVQDRLVTYERPTYQEPTAPVYPPRAHARAGARQLNGVTPQATPSNPPRGIAQPGRSPSSALPNRSVPRQRLPTGPSAAKSPVEVITIDDDTDSSSSSSSVSAAELRTFFRENNLDDIRPFKRRRVDETTLAPQQNTVVNQQRPTSINGTSATSLRPSIERNGVRPLHHASPVIARPFPLTSSGQPLSNQRGDTVLPRALSIASKPKSSTPRILTTAPASRAVASNSRPITTRPEGSRTDTPLGASRGRRNADVNEALPATVATDAAGGSASDKLQSQNTRSESELSSALTYESAHTGQHSDSQPSRSLSETSRGKQADADIHGSAGPATAATFQESTGIKLRGRPYSQAENEILFRLREKQKLGWKEILPHLPGRSMGSISGHYSELLAGKHKANSTPSILSQQNATKAKPYLQTEGKLSVTSVESESLDTNRTLPHSSGRTTGLISEHHGQLESQLSDAQPKVMASAQRNAITVPRGVPYSQAEDELLIKLKEVEKLDWNSLLPYFPGRTMGSISGHYGQLKSRAQQGKPEAIKPFLQSNASGNHGIPYSAEEDALIVKLKEVDNISWHEIAPFFPGRTWTSLQTRYSSKLKSKSKAHISKPTRPIEQTRTVEQAGTTSSHGVPYSPEEDALILKLKDEGFSWDQMVAHFNGRTLGSLAVRYSSKLKDRQNRNAAVDDGAVQPTSTDDDAAPKPQRRRQYNGPSVLSGFISWADIKKSRRHVFEDEESAAEDEDHSQKPSQQSSWAGGVRSHAKSMQRILRQRELGTNCGRGWRSTTRSIPDELREHVFDNIGPRKYFQGTSGDVTCIAWAADGNRFAAGSIAITDERSMQYNKPCNLLFGDTSESILYELPEHHIPRPANTDTGNVNTLQSMRETQDQRLFMTVGSVQFSADGKTLYSAGTDRKVRAYSTDGSIRAACQYEIEHPAPVYLLSVSNQNILATACHQSADDSIRVHSGQSTTCSLSPSRVDSQTERPVFPSALRWGTSSYHSNLLLAGFSIDSIDEERNMAGETCLWDVHHEVRIEINAVTRNVFDVAWNPSPSSSSTAFAVASTPGVNKVNRGTRTVLQCFAPRQNRAAPVLEFESRAFDINDVVYCPHDNNLIAAGATDGKIYLWDQRYAKKGSGPLQVLAHGQSLDVLDHYRDTELVDTGVRFLSWGATSSRLYSGSSDGVVKMWNPYRSSSEAHIKDVTAFTSAIMSGAFSPDYREVLIGEDQGRINLLSVGHENKSMRSMDRFELKLAPASSRNPASGLTDGRKIARELLNSGQIELKPMGAMPMRQAVQGQNYTGPYLAPSFKELQDAESEYQVALNIQNEAHSDAAMNSTQGSDVSHSLRDADKRVEAAQETVLRLQSRLDDSATLAPRAEATQRAFRTAEKDHIKEASLSRALQSCKLDCNYLPPNVDEDAEATDSKRSEARIPIALWKVPETNTSDMDVDELIEAGLTEKCTTCLKPARKPKKGLPACDSCARKKSGFTATCGICASPIRPSVDGKVPSLCERCNFACFRCGKPASIASNLAKISCYACDLSWTAGVLGYELVR